MPGIRYPNKDGTEFITVDSDFMMRVVKEMYPRESKLTRSVSAVPINLDSPFGTRLGLQSKFGVEEAIDTWMAQANSAKEMAEAIVKNLMHHLETGFINAALDHMNIYYENTEHCRMGWSGGLGHIRAFGINLVANQYISDDMMLCSFDTYSKVANIACRSNPFFDPVAIEPPKGSPFKLR